VRKSTPKITLPVKVLKSLGVGVSKEQRERFNSLAMDRQIEVRERLFEQVTTSFEQFVLRRFPEKERQQIQELLRQSIALELEMSLREGERQEQTL
jgi:hypothetical protein